MSKSDYKKFPQINPNKQRGFGDIKVRAAVKQSLPLQASAHLSNSQPIIPKKNLSGFLSKFKSGKIYAAVSTTFVLTLGLSFAGSQVMAHIGQQDQTNTIANASSALTVTSNPSTLTLSPEVISNPNLIYLPMEKIQVPDPLSERKEFLKSYLESKDSPLANHVDALSEQTQWKLIIAIANAESSYCKHNALHNCWGIGGAWNLKAYSNYDQAIADVNRILEQHYIAAGLTSPKKIESKWVGYKDQNWEAAADQVMEDLKNVR